MKRDYVIPMDPGWPKEWCLVSSIVKVVGIFFMEGKCETFPPRGSEGMSPHPGKTHDIVGWIFSGSFAANGPYYAVTGHVVN